MKKTLIAGLAALMVAGALSAATVPGPNPGSTAIVVGEGSAPLPTTFESLAGDHEPASTNHF